MSALSARQLFLPLNGKTYETYLDLEDEMIGVYNKVLGAFPPNYTCEQLLEYGERRGWVVPQGSTSYRVDIG